VGSHRFDAYALASNHEAIRVLTRLGPTTMRELDNEVELEIELGFEHRSPPAA
jgi:hypothetical protein